MKYREFLSLTDEEIRFIVHAMFDTEKIENISRNEKYNEITCDITTGGWDDGEDRDFEITDELTLTMPSFHDDGLSIHNFFIKSSDIIKWKQFLLAKGCDNYLKDNPY